MEIERDPPVLKSLLPLVKITLPPVYTLPSPGKILKDPAAPELADPLRNTTEPLLPLEVRPVLMVILPLVAALPLAAVRTLNIPLLRVIANPLVIDIDPPVAFESTPLLKTKRPPLDTVPEPTAILILPLVPSLASPERRATDPEEPIVDIPVDTKILPEIPVSPASFVFRVNAPLLVS